MNSHSVPATTARSTARLSSATAPIRRRSTGASSVRPTPDKRQRILTAAVKTFARHGFFNAQVADVARAAGVASGTVYLYFRSKDDLLVSIFERSMREALAEGRRTVAPIA